MNYVENEAIFIFIESIMLFVSEVENRAVLKQQRDRVFKKMGAC